ncbi:MAG TPA: DUF2142 domain-containing protein, partial [Acidimicrobiales bacterium]|nr:DUF2142 domain-containing protein [Acidimicrobiales bacterium]
MITRALSALRSDTRRGRRWRWWGSVTLFTLLVSVWSLATPLMAAPDEPAHVTKAAAVVRLQFLGTPEPFKKASGISPIITVHVPAAFGHRRPPCYSNHPDRPASCQLPIRASSGRLVPATTYEGRFPPLYYFFAGLPTLVLHDAAAIRLMRLVSAVLAGLFLASALESAFRCRRGSHMVLGVVVAATPMALFLAGTVNPSGLEIAAAISLWSAGVCLLVDHGARTDRRLLARAGVAGAVLAQCRGLSLVWVALIGLCLL